MRRYRGRRRYNRGRSLRRRYRRSGRRSGRRRGGYASRVYSFKRSTSIQTITASSSGDVAGALTLSLGSLTASGDFTALFDSYKITYVKWFFLPQGDVTSLGSAPGLFITAVDYDDDNVPARVDLLQYPGRKIVRGDRPFTVGYRPKIASSVYRPGTLAGYSPTTAWIDAAYTDVSHYGLKYVWTPQNNSTYIQKYDVYATVYVKMRNVR